MNIILARTAGFCFGVKRAVRMAEELQGRDNVYTLGPIIHNRHVTRELEEKGIKAVSDISELKAGDTVVIRSHGVGRDVYERLREMGVDVIDATCPFVEKIHKYVDDMSREGRKIIIIGDSEHPEVKGIKGWCRTEAFVVDSKADVEALPLENGDLTAVVAQTTYNYKRFKELVEIILGKGYHSVYLGTVCNATRLRQEEAIEIASKADGMIVVGDSESSNSRKLYEVCRNICKSTFFITKLDDLHHTDIGPLQNVGITAGASTPENLIEEVQTYVRTEL